MQAQAKARIEAPVHGDTEVPDMKGPAVKARRLSKHGDAGPWIIQATPAMNAPVTQKHSEGSTGTA